MNESDIAVTDTVDTRDMVVVHTALLREIRLAPAAVERAEQSGSARNRTRTGRHVRLMLEILEHHHAGEDRLLHPLLLDRVPPESLATVHAGEEQHGRIENLISEAHTGLDRWTGGDAGAASELVRTMSALHTALEPHLRAEERDVLPLVATHLSAAEWAAVGEAGSSSVPKSALLLVFGMFLYEGDPDVLRDMLAPAPAPVRMLVPRLAPGVYARLCRAVHGTARP